MLPHPAKNLVSWAVVPVRACVFSARRALVLAVAVVLIPAAVSAAAPAEALQKSIDEGLGILRDPSLRAPDRRDLQLQHLRRLLYRDFDFAEFSRRVLADKWAVFSEAERVEFIAEFSRFLADHYLPRLQLRYTDERVVLRGQQLTAPGRAVVRTGVVVMNRELPVEVRLHSRGGVWKVYDVSAFGISAAQLYRAQFQEILRTHSPPQAIELIRRRNQE